MRLTEYGQLLHTPELSPVRLGVKLKSSFGVVEDNRKAIAELGGKLEEFLEKTKTVQAINQERDSKDFNWTSASLKQNCPKSVELIEKWDGN